MRKRRSSFPGGIALATMLALAYAGPGALAENIDPGNSGDQYAWGENTGWLNAEPQGNGGSGIVVEDFKLTGWIWGENIGWISLSCENTASCGRTNFGVTNNGFGTLDGFAWGENVGWIRFGPPFSGVAISAASGAFSGYAWGENIGWVHFASTGPVPFRVQTDWCQTTSAPPGAGFKLQAFESGINAKLLWTPLAGASWYDVVWGKLSTLRLTGGDFAVATSGCFAQKLFTTTVIFTEPGPADGDGFWFLVRGANCRGHGTYDTGQPSQIGARDAEIAASGADCP